MSCGPSASRPGWSGGRSCWRARSSPCEGILLGAALSIVTSYLLFRNDDDLQGSGVPFPVPWMSITVLVAATAAASLAATAWPARQASRIKPAVALRIAD